MILSRLNDAALAMFRTLDAAGIKHGIFGGYAISTLGGPRESKDVDCIASASKQQIVALMDGKEGFQLINQSREDYVAFFWSDKPDRRDAVLVEIFVENFNGARFGMADIALSFRQVAGASMGVGYTAHLNPAYVFKGKLRAAATRAKFHDSADIRWLEGHFSAMLQQQRGDFSLEYAGLAMKRYPELELCLTRIGIDIEAAKNIAHSMNLAQLPPPQRGDVQKGLLQRS